MLGIVLDKMSQYENFTRSSCDMLTFKNTKRNRNYLDLKLMLYPNIEIDEQFWVK